MLDIKRVALYIRVSTDQQIKGDSLQEQQDTLENYVASNENLLIHDTYIDGGASGQKIDRDEFSRLLKDIEKGRIDLIIFTKLDRWFRSLKHYLNTQDLLVKHNVEWLSVSQPFFNTDTAYGRAFVANSMTWAELEAQMASERIKSVFANKVAHGEVISGTTPLGYDIVKKRLSPSEDSYKIPLIFEHYLTFNSLNLTVQYMANELGIVRDQRALKRLLTNKKYIGEFRDNNNYCTPLVELDTFGAVQKLLSKNIKSTRTRRTYIFSGLIRCQCCHCRFAGLQRLTGSNKEGERQTINAYRCNIAWGVKRCDNKYYIVEYQFEQRLLSVVKPLIREYLKENESREKKIVKKANNRSEIERKLKRLKTAYLNELISLEEFRQDKEDFERLLKKTEDASAPKNFDNLKRLLETDLSSVYPEFSVIERQQFWRNFIEEIEVDHDRKIKVIFK